MQKVAGVVIQVLFAALFPVTSTPMLFYNLSAMIVKVTSSLSSPGDRTVGLAAGTKADHLNLTKH